MVFPLDKEKAPQIAPQRLCWILLEGVIENAQLFASFSPLSLFC
jgi:hypothetical protein